MNWGGFAGGFASGFAGGVAMGKTIQDAMKQKKIEDVRAQGMAEAQAARASAIDGAIKEGPATTGITGKPAEEVTAPSTQPTESIVPNPEKAAGATVTPVTDAGATPSSPAGVTTPSASGSATPTSSATPTTGEGAKAIAQEQPKPITPQASEQPAEKPATTGSTPAAKGLPFMVGGKGYATREEARAAAEKSTPGVMEFMSKTLVPKMQEAYLAQGNVEMAEAWGKWAEERDNKAAMKEWASAYRAAQMGNIEKAADHVFNLYKKYDDGITPLSKEAVKDKAGNVTGFNVRLKTEATGEERTQFIGKRELTEMGLAALSPQAMFELQFKRQAEADKVAAASAAKIAEETRAEGREIRKEARGEARDIRKDERTQANALEKLTIEKQLEEAKIGTGEKRKIQAKVDTLRAGGYSEEFINGVLPGIIGVGDYKKATSPEEARRLAHSDRMKADPMYGRKSPEEQKKILDQDMALIYSGVKPSSTIAASAPATPAAGGLPQAGAAPAKKGTPIYDTKTGTIIYR